MMQKAKAGDRDRALALCPELAAIAAELAVYEDLLRRWQKTINLVSPGTLDHLWSRHFADSAPVRAAESTTFSPVCRRRPKPSAPAPSRRSRRLWI